MQKPRPEDHGDRRQRGLPTGLIDHWAQVAVDRPVRYVASWAIGIGGANFGLRLLLNDRSMADNAGLAILYGVGFSVFAWRYTTQRTRRLQQSRSRPAAKPAGSKERRAARWRSGEMPVHRSSASGGPRSGRLWSCPEVVVASARPGGQPPAPSSRRGRHLVVAAVAVTAVSVALLVATTAN